MTIRESKIRKGRQSFYFFRSIRFRKTTGNPEFSEGTLSFVGTLFTPKCFMESEHLLCLLSQEKLSVVSRPSFRR